ncbi:MAG: citrate lyase subunit alpha [Spirochaetaceae bacterium]|nr:citrate lyase subunit alpha [Spirochaetaceae bacterium]
MNKKQTFKAFNPENIETKNEAYITHRVENNKIVESLEEAIKATGLKDGMTISFHHHFRNGDHTVNLVLDTLNKMGYKDLYLASSSLNVCHEPIISHIKSGLITQIDTSGLRGPLADAISHGIMDKPVIFRSHGGRAAAIESGVIVIDVAFLGVPSCDPLGNANGYSRDDERANDVICGSLGYAKSDAEYAKNTIILSNHIVPYPNTPFGIPESQVDYIVEVDDIGDPSGIMSGATRFTTNPKELLIAEKAATVIINSGFFINGFSIQFGSGGASLAVAQFLKPAMIERKYKARFALGGISASVVELHEEGLIEKLLDVQSFDLKAANSLKNNRFHQQISASYYASPLNLGAAVNQLDIVVLSALEVDINFNVNVLTGADGIIRGAIGGHQDTAAGARLAVVVVPLLRGRIPCVVDKVNTLVTPGKSVDVVVTDYGIAVNPARKKIIKIMEENHIKIMDLKELYNIAVTMTGIPKAIAYTDKVVGNVTYRDGTLIDKIYQVKD